MSRSETISLLPGTGRFPPAELQHLPLTLPQHVGYFFPPLHGHDAYQGGFLLKGQDAVAIGYGAQRPEHPPGDLLSGQFPDLLVTVEYFEYAVQFNV